MKKTFIVKFIASGRASIYCEEEDKEKYFRRAFNKDIVIFDGLNDPTLSGTEIKLEAIKSIK
jgi:hypothetical protein